MSERWTEFQGSPIGTDRGQPRVTLNNRNVLMLSKTAYEALGMPAAVKLMYEENRRIIGLKPADPQLKNAFPVRINDKWSNRRIHLHPYCRHFGIDVRLTLLFTEIEIDNQGMMRLDMNRTVTIGRAERVKK